MGQGNRFRRSTAATRAATKTGASRRTALEGNRRVTNAGPWAPFIQVRGIYEPWNQGNPKKIINQEPTRKRESWYWLVMKKERQPAYATPGKGTSTRT